jgi:hypothetical protein
VDGGVNWSLTPDLLFPEITGAGRSGWNDMAVDGNGVIHAVSLPALHSVWRGKLWGATNPIAPGSIAEQGGEKVRMNISRGNQVNVVWNTKIAQPYGIWFAYGSTGSPPITPRPSATARTLPTQTPGLAELNAAVPTPSPVPTLQPEARNASTTYQTNPTLLIFAGFAPAFLILILVVWLVRSKS